VAKPKLDRLRGLTYKTFNRPGSYGPGRLLFLMAANGPNLPIQPIEFYQLAASSLRLLAR
jgi:hypothetical protein